jgi:CheY-like chemotaxis protein
MKKILFVDNSKPIRLLLHNLLKKDYDVHAAANSSEAFQHIFEIEMPDLIIIDPSENEKDKANDNMFIQFLKSSVLFQHIQIIVLSKDIATLEQHLHRKIVNLFVEKPFDPIKLRGSISALLAS